MATPSLWNHTQPRVEQKTEHVLLAHRDYCGNAHLLIWNLCSCLIRASNFVTVHIWHKIDFPLFTPLTNTLFSWVQCTRQKPALPVLLQSLELVSRQGGWGQLNQPAQDSRGQPAGCLHAHAVPGVFVPAKASASTQTPPLLLPRGAHEALLPAGLVPDGSTSATASALPEGLKIHSEAGWCLRRKTQHHKTALWKYLSKKKKKCTS